MRTPTPTPPIALAAARRLARDTTPYRRPAPRFASLPARLLIPGWRSAVRGIGGRQRDVDAEDGACRDAYRLDGCI